MEGEEYRIAKNGSPVGGFLDPYAASTTCYPANIFSLQPTNDTQTDLTFDIVIR